VEEVHNEDFSSEVKKSYKNPAVIELYNNFLDAPGEEKAHKLLHTKYLKRDNKIV